MLKKLRQLLLPESPPEHPPLPPEGLHRGAALRLPPGTVVAEQGLRRAGDAVHAQFDEAYVVVRLHNRQHWYATWLPYSGGWDLLRLEEDAMAELPEPARAAIRKRALAQ